jgi:hypothetical protein
MIPELVKVLEYTDKELLIDGIRCTTEIIIKKIEDMCFECMANAFTIA